MRNNLDEIIEERLENRYLWKSYLERVLTHKDLSNFAQKRYSGDETQAVQSLITDMSGTQMDQQPVPPDTQMAELPESGVEGPLNAVDTEGEVV